MKRFLLIILTLTLLTKPALAFDHEYKSYAASLKEFVKGDRVDYWNLKGKPLGINTTIMEYEKVTKAEYSKWNEQQQFAFWLNAYNLFILKIVVENYPIESIRELGPPLVGPWFKSVFRILGKERSLREIENKILRKKFKDPRLHFALNCASISCPALRAEPYIHYKLNVQDDSRNRLDQKKKILYLSKIFKWYKKDFTNRIRLIDFLARFMKAEDLKFLQEHRVEQEYLKYNWKLNDLKK